MTSWSTRRQLTYFFSFLTVLIAGVAVAAAVLWPRASCQDGRRNQNELGVDCGGPPVGGCPAVCSSEAFPVRALWSRVLPIGASTYDLVALVSNPNADLRAWHLPYEIKFVDQGNALINSIRGEISLWPQEIIPIFVSDISVGKRIPARSYLEFIGAPRWERSSSTAPTLTVTDDNLNNLPAPVLKARLTNNSPQPISKVEVVVLLSDSEHNVFAASTTLTERLGAGETTEISFTWPRPFDSLPVFTEFYPHVAIESAD